MACKRDDKGRFARHEFDMTFMEAISKDAEYITCKRCGRRKVITNLIKLIHRKPFSLTFAPVLSEKNEILTDLEFKEAG